MWSCGWKPIWPAQPALSKPWCRPTETLTQERAMVARSSCRQERRTWTGAKWGQWSRSWYEILGTRSYQEVCDKDGDVVRGGLGWRTVASGFGHWSAHWEDVSVGRLVLCCSSQLEWYCLAVRVLHLIHTCQLEMYYTWRQENQRLQSDGGAWVREPCKMVTSTTWMRGRGFSHGILEISCGSWWCWTRGVCVGSWYGSCGTLLSSRLLWVCWLDCKWRWPLVPIPSCNLLTNGNAKLWNRVARAKEKLVGLSSGEPRLRSSTVVRRWWHSWDVTGTANLREFTVWSAELFFRGESWLWSCQPQQKMLSRHTTELPTQIYTTKNSTKNTTKNTAATPLRNSQPTPQQHHNNYHNQHDKKHRTDTPQKKRQNHKHKTRTAIKENHRPKNEQKQKPHNPKKHHIQKPKVILHKVHKFDLHKFKKVIQKRDWKKVIQESDCKKLVGKSDWKGVSKKWKTWFLIIVQMKWSKNTADNYTIHMKNRTKNTKHTSDSKNVIARCESKTCLKKVIQKTFFFNKHTKHNNHKRDTRTHTKHPCSYVVFVFGPCFFLFFLWGIRFGGGILFFPVFRLCFFFAFVFFITCVRFFVSLSLSCLLNNFFNHVFESFFRKSDWQQVIGQIHEKSVWKNVIEKRDWKNDWKTWLKNVIAKIGCKKRLNNVIEERDLKDSAETKWVKKVLEQKDRKHDRKKKVNEKVIEKRVIQTSDSQKVIQKKKSPHVFCCEAQVHSAQMLIGQCCASTDPDLSCSVVTASFWAQARNKFHSSHRTPQIWVICTRKNDWNK